MTSVTSLLETPFLTRDPTRQLATIELGRPLPSLKLASVEIIDGNTIVHSFNAEIYKNNDWICGCPDTNAFFCFPCLLFQGDDHWSTSGYDNMVHLANATSKHELSPVHMSNVFNYSKLSRKSRTDQMESMQDQNNRTEKNLQVLDAIIDCIKFCAYSSIPISKETDEEEGEPFQDLLMFMTSSDSLLRNYLQQEPFQDLESIKMDIMEAASEVIREEIGKEIEQTEFVSMIVGNGDSEYPRMIILRYVISSEPVERVLKIIHYENMNRLFDDLLTEIRTAIKKPNKLISQSYDQITLKKQDASFKLYVKVQSYFPQAHLVHFYNHDVFEIVYHSVIIQKNFQSFSAMVWDICKFMSDEPWSSGIKPVFEEVRKRFYKGVKTEEPYDFTKDKIESVYQHKRVLLGTMTAILENCQAHPAVTVYRASNLQEMLEDEMNNYMLETFFKIIPFLKRCIYEYENCLTPTNYANPDTIRSILDDSSETEMHQIGLNLAPLSNTNQEIQVKVEDDFEINDIDLSQVKIEIPTLVPISRNTDSKNLPNTSKRKTTEDDNVPTDCKKDKAVEAVQSVMVQLQELLKYRTNMFAAQLVDPRNFDKFSKDFPEHFLTTAVGDLPFFTAFDSMKLRTELGVLYAQHEYQSLTSSCDLLKDIMENNLATTFPQTVKLLRIVSTFPSKTDDPQRCFRTREKVLQFLNDCSWYKNVDCLVYFRCERIFVENIDEFNKKVIRKFLHSSDQAVHFKGTTF